MRGLPLASLAAACLILAPSLAAPQSGDSTAAPKVPPVSAPAEKTPPEEKSTVANPPMPAPAERVPAEEQGQPAAKAEPARAPVHAPRILTPAQTAGVKPGSMCGVCHPDVRVQSERGVHRSEGVGCNSCHGGDPNATTVATAHRAPFRGIPRRRDVPALCASCHSQVERMRPYNLPSDQYVLYQTSQHGIRLAKGDEHVAVCTDCHGVHGILPPSDPRSSVFARNIPNTCGKCHGDPKLLHLYNKKDDPLADYTAGVHGKAFLAEGNTAAPECTRCHGSHSATPPGVGDVEKVCGQCHSRVRSYFLAGPHRDAMKEAGLPECAACHGNHRIQPATPAMLDKVCLECHEAGGKEAKLAGQFHSMVTRASGEIDRAEKMVREAQSIPLYVEDYKARLTDARTALMEAYPAMHALDVSVVEPHTRRAWSIASQVSHEVHEKLAGRVWRIVGLVLFWFYLLVTAAIVMRARRRAVAERDR